MVFIHEKIDQETSFKWLSYKKQRNGLQHIYNTSEKLLRLDLTDYLRCNYESQVCHRVTYLIMENFEEKRLKYQKDRTKKKAKFITPCSKLQLHVLLRVILMRGYDSQMVINKVGEKRYLHIQ